MVVFDWRWVVAGETSRFIDQDFYFVLLLYMTGGLGLWHATGTIDLRSLLE